MAFSRCDEPYCAPPPPQASPCPSSPVLWGMSAWCCVLFFVAHLPRLSDRPVCLQTVRMDSDPAPPMVSLFIFCPSASCVIACNCKPLTSSAKSIPLYYHAVITKTPLAVDRDLGCFQHLSLRVPLWVLSLCCLFIGIWFLFGLLIS